MIMAARSFAHPTIQQLNAEALAGDCDACLQLANRSMSCRDLTEFLNRFVPADETLRCFDCYADAFAKSRMRALLDTLELPAVAKTNVRGIL
jgi:hypothetical protein